MMTKSVMTSRLRMLREESGKTYDEIARELWDKGHKISVAMLVRAERGSITLKTAKMLSEYWGLPVGELV